MPTKPKKPCSYQGCPKLTNDRYCELHQKKRTEEYNKYERDNFTKIFYNSKKWRIIRKRQLEAHPFCEECLKNGKRTKAIVVDHIIPIKKGGDMYDYTNLQSLCASCHSKKSVLEGSRFGKNVFEKFKGRGS